MNSINFMGISTSTKLAKQKTEKFNCVDDIINLAEKIETYGQTGNKQQLIEKLPSSDVVELAKKNKPSLWTRLLNKVLKVKIK